MNKNFARRIGIAVPLGILFGILCTFFAQGTNPGIWGSPLMWNIIFNRFLIGFVIALAGAYAIHPVFGIRMYPVLRGFLLGALISVSMALGVLMSNIPNQTSIFWGTIIMGGIYGLIIDFLASRYGGEGHDILAN